MHRSFKVTPIPDECPTFDLSGVDSKGEAWEESFRCLARAPGGAVDRVMRSMSTDGDGNLVLHRASIVDFMLDVLQPDDRARFRNLMNDPVRLVPLDPDMRDVFMWLAGEVFGDRPTGQPSA